MTTIERQIVTQIITDVIKAGCRITVDNGEDDVIRSSTDADAVLAALNSTDEDTLNLSLDNNVYLAWVHLVYGNDGHDVINDYTVNLEPVLIEANALADRLADDAAGHPIYGVNTSGEERLVATVYDPNLIPLVMQAISQQYTNLRCGHKSWKSES